MPQVGHESLSCLLCLRSAERERRVSSAHPRITQKGVLSLHPDTGPRVPSPSETDRRVLAVETRLGVWAAREPDADGECRTDGIVLRHAVDNTRYRAHPPPANHP